MKRASLARLVILPHSALFLAGLLFVVWAALHFIRKAPLEATEDHFRETATYLAGAPVLRRDMLEQVKRVVGAEVATVSRDRKILETTLEESERTRLEAWLAASEVERGAGGTADLVELGGATHHAFFAAASRPAGISPYPSHDGVLLLVPSATLEARWEPFVARMVWIGLATLVSVWLVGAWIAQSIARPIRLLVGKAEAIAGGEFTERIPESGTIEFVRLADAIHKMVESLVESARKVQEGQRLAALGSLAASVAHEVNNPLTSIRMTLDRVRERSREPETIESLTVVATDVARLERIAADLLYTARPPALALARALPARVFGEVAKIFARMLAHREIRLEILADPPDAAIEADPGQLKQVFMNLLTNAARAIGSGGEIRVSFETAPPELRVRFADSGPGVPPNERERIFEPFVSLKPGGTGLGLAVVKKIVEEHRGRIRCAHVERGAVFEMTFPLYGARDDPAARRPG